METILTLFSHGIPAHDYALTVVRVLLGGFFVASGMNKLVNPSRHAALVETLKKDKVPALWFTQWWVPSWEFMAGTTLVFGFLTAFSASVLFIVCFVACLCEAKQRVDDYKPINRADRYADYLYLPEVLYLLLLVVFMFGGVTGLSVDALIAGA